MDRVQRLSTADKVIVVSANAADLALPLLAMLSSENKDTFFAVGPSTAGVLEAEGYQVHIPENQYSSEGLLELWPLKSVQDQTIAIVCGSGGREYLERRLYERGAVVDRIELYRRRPIAVDREAIQSMDSPDIVTAMSGDTLNALSSTLINENRQNWKNLPLIVPSQRVAEMAVESGFTKVITAAKPTAESLLDLVVELAEDV